MRGGAWILLFGIIGGDRRQEVLLDLLRKDGYPVAAYGVAGEADWENAVTAEVVILPLPLCREGDTLNMEGEQRGVGALFHRLRRDQLILAGQVKPAQRTEALELDLNLWDISAGILILTEAGGTYVQKGDLYIFGNDDIQNIKGAP